jgi:HEAT repeat protein
MEYVAERLANLASELMQEKYIANATAAEYLLPEEILEDAYDIARLVKSENDIVASLTPQAKTEILRLVPLLEEEAIQGTVKNCQSPRELLQSPTWMALRRQALACLQAMQFDLAAWEQRQ